MFLGHPDPLVRGTDPDPSLFSYKGVERTEIMLEKQNLNTKYEKIIFLRLKIMCLWVSYKKKI
jgi:hypothetical protein